LLTCKLSRKRRQRGSVRLGEGRRYRFKLGQVGDDVGRGARFRGWGFVVVVCCVIVVVVDDRWC